MDILTRCKCTIPCVLKMWFIHSAGICGVRYGQRTLFYHRKLLKQKKTRLVFSVFSYCHQIS